MRCRDCAGSPRRYTPRGRRSAPRSATPARWPTLAGELARAGGDHRRAFDAYEKRLRPFIEGKQASAAKFIWFFATRTRFGLWFRNVAMRTMNFGPLATLFAGSVRDDFELPDYTW